MIDHIGVAPERFGLVFGAVVLGYIAGAYGGSRTGMRFGLAARPVWAAVICVAAGGGLLLSGWSGVGGVWAIAA